MSRDELLAALERAMRRASGQGVLFSQAVADRLGLTPTDVESMGFLDDEGPMSAGRLAELTGLTTGAVTRMIDRLESAGYVRRGADPSDRRRVIVELVPERIAAVYPLYDPMRQRANAQLAAYSDDELRLILRFLDEASAVTETSVAELRQGAATRTEDEVVYPLAAARAGRLSFTSGASRVTLGADASAENLLRARFEGPPPQVTVRDGDVRIRYRRSFLDWRERTAQLGLGAAIPWELRFRGGLSRLNADLRALELRRMEVEGGASQLDVSLPRPKGTVHLQVTGGVSQVAVHRPPGTEVRVDVSGGANLLALDGRRSAAIGGTRLETPAYGTSRDRYRVEITGGASSVEVDAW